MATSTGYDIDSLWFQAPTGYDIDSLWFQAPTVKHSSSKAKATSDSASHTDTAADKSLSGAGLRGGGDEGGLLLHGNYDEESSAASFQEALAAWRKGSEGKSTHSGNASWQSHHCPLNLATDSSSNTSTLQTTGSTTHTSSATQADRSEERTPEIEFSGRTGVSYFERLVMRRCRVEPTFHIRQRQKETPRDAEDLQAHNTAISEYNLFYGSDDTSCAHESEPLPSRDWVLPMSTVCIEEMNFQHCKEEEEDVKEIFHQPRGPKPSARREVDTVGNSDSPGGQGTLVEGSPCGIAASVRLAWTESSRWRHSSDQLAQFFLSGVDSSGKQSSGSECCREREEKSEVDQPTLASLMWLPGSSILHSGQDGGDGPPHTSEDGGDGPPHTTEDGGDGPPHTTEDGGDGPPHTTVSHGTAHAINVPTDLPPVAMRRPPCSPSPRDSEEECSDSELVFDEEEEGEGG